MASSERYLLRCAKILLALSLCIPLAVFPSHFIYPFVVPKVLLFRSLVEALLGLWLLLLIAQPGRFGIRLSATSVLVAALHLIAT